VVLFALSVLDRWIDIVFIVFVVFPLQALLCCRLQAAGCRACQK
jgi:hypothetical protein